MNVKELQAERTSIFNDVYNNIIPKRVPVNLMFGFEFTAEYGGFDIRETQWNPGMIREACEKVCRDIYSDVLPASGASLDSPPIIKFWDPVLCNGSQRFHAAS